MSTPKPRNLEHFKSRAIEEFKLYWIVFAYLAIMFGAFTTYRRLVMAEAGVSYGHLGAGLIEAAVLAKIILVGQALELGKRSESRPLIVSVLVKALAYGFLVALFHVVERAIEALLHGGGWAAIEHRVLMYGPDEMLARTVMVFVSFVPFFALWETARVLGPGKLFDMFLRGRPPEHRARISDRRWYWRR